MQYYLVQNTLLFSVLFICVISLSGADEAGKKPKISKEKTALEIYRRLFKQKRAAQMDAVKTMMKLEGYDKQFKMISVVLEKLFKVMGEARLKLMEAGFTPGDPVPLVENIRDAFSNIAENTAFFGDILLRFPDISHQILNKNREWDLQIKWSISFCNETQVFAGADVKLLNLMAQELNIVERDPNYVNPFKEDTKKIQLAMEEELKKMKENQKKEEKRKKREKRKGPRLSSPSHAEL